MTEEYNPFAPGLVSMLLALDALRTTVPDSVLRNAYCTGKYKIKPGRIEQVPTVMAVWEDNGLVFYININ